MLRYLMFFLGLMGVVVVGGCAQGTGPASRPLVIAHRGASGYLPEHTLAAYALAYGQGADVIEPDVTMTRDGVLICAHDLTAEAVTDVAQVFPGRARADGKWYFADLTLAEVRRLSVLGRAERRPTTGPLPGLGVPTLKEMIELVQTLNARTGRNVGIIPEPKSPEFHRENKLPIEGPLVATLAACGYSKLGARAGGATIQCFDLEALRRIRFEERCELPLAYTVREPVDMTKLREATKFVQALGPSRKLVEPDAGAAAPVVDILAFASRYDLDVYCWTFGDEPEVARRFFTEHRVAGVFIDFPDVGVRARDAGR